MALIECQECKKYISEKAQSCPECGHPVENTGKSGSMPDTFKSMDSIQSEKYAIKLIIIPIIASALMYCVANYTVYGGMV
jgi:hypothetical protein